MSETRVWCNNQDEFFNLMDIVGKLGYNWEPNYNPTAHNPYVAASIDPSSGVCICLENDDHRISFDTDTTYHPNIEKTESIIDFIVQEGIELDGFAKSQLSDGMIVQLKNNEFYMYFKKFDSMVCAHTFIKMSYYGQDLTCAKDPDYDIVAVYVPSKLTSFNFAHERAIDHFVRIWKRSTEVVMTLSEVEEKLGIKNLKIVDDK